MNISGVSMLIVIAGLIPCVILPLFVLGYIFIRERRK